MLMSAGLSVPVIPGDGSMPEMDETKVSPATGAEALAADGMGAVHPGTNTVVVGICCTGPAGQADESSDGERTEVLR